MSGTLADLTDPSTKVRGFRLTGYRPAGEGEVPVALAEIEPQADGQFSAELPCGVVVEASLAAPGLELVAGPRRFELVAGAEGLSYSVAPVWDSVLRVECPPGQPVEASLDVEAEGLLEKLDLTVSIPATGLTLEAVPSDWVLGRISSPGCVERAVSLAASDRLSLTSDDRWEAVVFLQKR